MGETIDELKVPGTFFLFSGYIASGLTPTVSLRLRQRYFIYAGRGILAKPGGRSKEKNAGNAFLR
jgi:hypothetical protein